MSVIPLFSSCYSFSARSILTVEEASETIDENKPVSIFNIAKHFNFKKVFLCDKTLSGLIEAYNAANKLGVELCFGWQVIYCEDINDKTDKSFCTEQKIIVWLNDSAGYEKFVKLVSKAQTDGLCYHPYDFLYIPRIDKNILKEFWSDSFSIAIPFYDSFIHKNNLKLGKCIPEFPCKPILFLENHGLPFDAILSEKVINYAENNNLEIYNTHFICYYKEIDYKAYLTNRCIENRSQFDKPELEHNSSDKFAFESANKLGLNLEENNFSRRFKKYDLPFYGIRLPNLTIDKSIKQEIGVDENSDNYVILKALCVDGFRKRIKNGSIKEEEKPWFKHQVLHELSILKKLGFVDYMLIVWDMINFCRRTNIPLGKGRGSSCGCVVAYLLGITDIPVKRHGLIFERFLSADRAATIEKNGITYLSDCPDIDTDISKEQRYKVVEYLNHKYPGQTSKIINITTYQGKALIKEVAKCIDGCEESYLNQITDLIPVEFGNVVDIEDCCNGLKNKNGEWIREPIENFAKFCKEFPDSYNIALKLRGLAKNKSVHASGYIITHGDIDTLIPTETVKDKNGNTHLASSFDMYSAGTIAVKIDLLGLKTLDILNNAAKLVGKKFDEINIDDPNIYQYLSNPESPYLGIFQSEDGLGKKTMKQIQPKTIDHISASLSLGRPGPMSEIPKYINFVKNNEVEEIHPKIDEILKQDANLIIYQESMMSLVNKVYGFSLKEANDLRKIIGKKLRDKVDAWEPKLIEGGKKNNIPEEATKHIWNIIKKSADYAFCKSHSYAYSYLTATTAYFKANHTKEFFLSLLKYPPENGDKKENFIPNINKELKFFGIKLLPPSLIIGNQDFILDEGNIRYGLNAIKGIAEAALQNLNNFKPESCNKFQMFQAARQAGLSCGVMAALIMSGALDIFVNESRSRLSFECLLFSKLKDKEKIYCIANGEKYNYDLIAMCKNILEWMDSRGKKIARATRLNTLRKNTVKYQEIYKNNKENEELASIFWERNLLGFNYSSTLKKCFSVGRDDILNLEEINNLDPYSSGVVVCFIDDLIFYTSKKGNKTLKLFISDETDSKYYYFAGKALQEYLIENKNELNIEVGDIVALKVQKSKDGSTGFIQRLKKQNCRIYTKLRDIKDAKPEEIEEFNQKNPEISQTEMIYTKGEK
jgi:DNA polymerase-3 subunit alpha